MTYKKPSPKIEMTRTFFLVPSDNFLTAGMGKVNTKKSVTMFMMEVR